MAQKAIGPTFYSELITYGTLNNVSIIGQHFNWSADGTLEFFSDTPAAVVTAVKAVYASHNPANLSLDQKISNAFASGLQITSTSTPALNGAYAVDALSQADIVAIETSINAGKGFPGGTPTFNYPDISGKMREFSQTQFTAFASAIRDYVYALKSVSGGASQNFPENTATIG